MSTSCLISKEVGDNQYLTIYCHFDGYPWRMLKLLKKSFNNESKIDELLSLGDCSSIYDKLYPTPGVVHTFLNPQEGVTVAYNRDRGEEDCEAKVYDRYTLARSNNDYHYLWTKDKGWEVVDWTNK